MIINEAEFRKIIRRQLIKEVFLLFESERVTSTNPGLKLLLFLLFGFSVGTSGSSMSSKDKQTVEAEYQAASDEQRLEMLQIAFDYNQKQNPTMSSTKSDASSPDKELILKYPGLGQITADERRNYNVRSASEREAIMSQPRSTGSR